MPAPDLSPYEPDAADAPTRATDEPAPSLLEKVRLPLLIAMLLLAVASLTWDLRGGDRETTVDPAAALVVVEDVAGALASATGASNVTGSFVPNVGLVAHVTVSDVARDDLATWTATALGPLGARVRAVSGLEHVVVLIDAADGSYTRSLIAPARTVDNAATYTIYTASSGAATPAAARAVTGSTTTAANGAKTTATTTTVANAASTTTAATKATTTSSAGSASTTTTPSAATIAFDTAAWTPLSGQWAIDSGSYLQKDATGYDYITQLNAAPSGAYTVKVTVAATGSSDINGGLIINQPKLGKRAGATMVDLTAQGTYLRWGHYDDANTYVFDGGVKLTTTVNATKGAEIAVKMNGTAGTVSLDGKSLGTFTAANAAGNVGLVSSQATLRFTNFSVGA